MFDDITLPGITEETLASWLDDMMNPVEATEFMSRYGADPVVSEVLDANDDVVAAYESMIEDGYELPEEVAGDFDLPFVSSGGDLFSDNDLFSDAPWSESQESTDDSPDHDDAMNADGFAPDSDAGLSDDLMADMTETSESADPYGMEDFPII